MKQPRHPLRPRVRLAAALALAPLAGCSLFAPAPTARFVTQVAAPAELLAWATAALAIERWPAADASPIRGTVPVLADDDGGFRVELGLGGGRAAFAGNGRLSSPGHRLEDGVRTRIDKPVFTPSNRSTRASGSEGWLSCAVSRGEDGCALDLELTGSAVDPDLLDRVRGLCALLNTRTSIDSAFAEHASALAAARCNQILSQLRRSNGSGLPELEAPVWSALAAARAELGDIAYARSAATSACDAAPGQSLYRFLLARIDKRLARFTGEHGGDGITQVAEVATDPRIRLAVRARLATQREEGELMPSSPTIAQRAAAMLAAGDVAGAEAWATRLRARAGQRSALAADEYARARGHRREAFVQALDVLGRERFDAALLERLCDDAIACGDAIAGLRVMSRHWPEMQRVDPARGAAIARRLIEVVGTSAAARIASSERCDAISLLAEGNTDDPRARADVAQVRRLDSARRTLDDQINGAALATPGR